MGGWEDISKRLLGYCKLLPGHLHMVSRVLWVVATVLSYNC